MDLIKFFVNLWKSCWTVLSDLRIDGVSWTSIVIAFFVFMVIVGGLLSARR